MRFAASYVALSMAFAGALAQETTDPGELTFTGSILTRSGPRSNSRTAGGDVPTGSLTYLSVSATSTVSTTYASLTGSETSSSERTSGSNGPSNGSSNGTSGDSSQTSTTPSVTVIGSPVTSSPRSGNSTASSTSSSAAPTNTQPCNNYPEFCTRKYSNITEITAHNSPFVRRGNAASNQQLPVTYQLNDGIRMLQGQIHMENGTLYYCHTSCNLLNAGTVEDYLRTVYEWVSTHPYDVVTILLGNFDQVDVENFVAPIQNSGLGRFAYEPPKVPMGLDDWPTLADMILRQKRVVFFMDYKANQTKVPYILDEFSQLWETPFSPTDPSFPCTVQRPDNINDKQARDRLYMANHNLNVEVSLAGIDLLIPNTAVLNVTNNVTGDDSLGRTARQCTADWGRPPNFLLVDYYNIPNGTVFEVAAQMNNVTYNRKCCGLVSTGAAASVGNPSLWLAYAVAGLSLLSMGWDAHLW